jgi:hypothetical protein
MEVNNEPIYRFDEPGRGWAIPVFGGTYTHFIRLKESYLGGDLSITFGYTSNNSFAGHFKPVYCGGTKTDLLHEPGEWPSLFYRFSLLLIGLLVVLFSLSIQTDEERKSFFYFGLVLLALGWWVFSQTPSKFILFRNPALPMNLSFAALFLLSLFVLLVIEYYRGNQDLKSFLIAMGFLLSSIVAELILLMLGISLDSAVILHFGMAVSAVVLFWRSATLMRIKTKSICKEQLLLSLAYSDALTEVGNRAAYDREVSRIQASKDIPKET